eukprot:TRINITY_DN820_c0_g1_i1.p1 TRINITY_DN820_c0_g1~~TRINITY_DN820_c0_g1_i1.p1  ORF type:complete len:250 (-),score=32.81 TRINITY_DN820_c0_g1_i1:52-801(-)
MIPVDCSVELAFLVDKSSSMSRKFGSLWQKGFFAKRQTRDETAKKIMEKMVPSFAKICSEKRIALDTRYFSFGRNMYREHPSLESLNMAEPDTLNGTLLFDSVYNYIKYIEDRISIHSRGNKYYILIVLSDGDDNRSSDEHQGLYHQYFRNPLKTCFWIGVDTLSSKMADEIGAYYISHDDDDGSDPYGGFTDIVEDLLSIHARKFAPYFGNRRTPACSENKITTLADVKENSVVMNYVYESNIQYVYN